jgi:sugar lactone lactonase YvrE
MKAGLLVISLFLAAPAVLSAAGVVAPVSGANGTAGFQDGKGATAIFNDPMGLARDSQGNVFLCDARNHVIRKISPAGVVSTVAGQAGVEGAIDAKGGNARFRFPADIAVSPAGDLYVADSGNHCIRKVKPDGTVSTVAGKLGSANDITADYGTTAYSVVAPALDGKGSAARFNGPCGIAYAGGFLYVSDTGNHLIRRIDLNNAVTTLAGKAGAWGAADGTGAAARFNAPMGICIGADGNVYIADSENHTIRRMTPQGAVTTYSGSAAEHGRKAGPRLDARYCAPVDICVHPDGGFIVCDSFASMLFRIDANGMVGIFSGETTPSAQTATLANPSSAVCDALGNVFVADTFNQELRMVIAKFGITLSAPAGLAKQMTLTWDSLAGRDYQLQLLTPTGWTNASTPPVRATGTLSTLTFPLPANPSTLYRIVLLGF